MPSWAYAITPATDVAGLAPDALTPLSAVVPKDLALDDSGDLALREENGVKVAYLVGGADAIVQRLRIRFGFWLGTWFLDLNQGIPYIEQILIKNPDLRLIENIFKKVILGTNGIRRINDFATSWDRPGRKLYVERFDAGLVDGTVLRLTETPFVVKAIDG
jgi:hypothetical protein